MSSKVSLAVSGPTHVHRLRYAKNKVLGMSIAEIAEEENVTPANITESIKIVELYRSLNTLDELEKKQIEILIFNNQLEQLALEGALRAERIIRRGEDGEEVDREPDHEMRLRAVEVSTKKVEALYSSKWAKQGGTTNVNIGLGVNVSTGMTFEDRLREIVKKREAITAEVVPPAPEPEKDPGEDLEG